MLAIYRVLSGVFLIASFGRPKPKKIKPRRFEGRATFYRQ